jgi:hypothetical protein
MEGFLTKDTRIGIISEAKRGIEGDKGKAMEKAKCLAPVE